MLPYQLTCATYGRTIFAGSTTRLNSASVTKPNFNAAAFNVRSLSIAYVVGHDLPLPRGARR
jgi:hypothetical protein